MKCFLIQKLLGTTATKVALIVCLCHLRRDHARSDGKENNSG